MALRADRYGAQSGVPRCQYRFVMLYWHIGEYSLEFVENVGERFIRWPVRVVRKRWSEDRGKVVEG